MSVVSAKVAGAQRESQTTSRFFGGGADRAATPFFSTAVPRLQSKCTSCEAERQIQPKLTVGQPDDKYEQEADRVAEQVMRMPAPWLSASIGDSLIQTKQITPIAQRQESLDEKGDEELVHAKMADDITPQVIPAINAGIQSLQGGGRALSRSDRSFFEPRFGAVFPDVRVHNDTRAANVARSVHARAFTLGRDVVFGAGEYSPGTDSGRNLPISHRQPKSTAHEAKEQRRQEYQPSEIPDIQRVPESATDEESSFSEQMRRWARDWWRSWLTEYLTTRVQLTENEFGLAFAGDWRARHGTVSETTINVILGDSLRETYTEAVREHLGDRAATDEVLANGLSALNVEFSLEEGSEFMELVEPAASADWRDWQSTVSARLLRPGGPVTVTAEVTLSGSEILVGTLTQSRYIGSASIAPRRVERVMRYRDVIEDVCAELGMRPDIVMAIISMETRGHPEAASGGYYGLMQAANEADILEWGRETGRDVRDFDTLLREYQTDIPAQITHGVRKFLENFRIARTRFRLPEPVTELSDADIVTILTGYGAGPGTIRAAIARAEADGRPRADWSRREYLIPALAEMGAYSVSFRIIRRITEGLSDAQLRDVLRTYCVPSINATGWDVRRMRESLQVYLERQRHGLMRPGVTLGNVTGPRHEWLLRCIEIKYNNLTSGGAYMREMMEYRQYYARLWQGHHLMTGEPSALGRLALPEREPPSLSPGRLEAPVSTEGTVRVESAPSNPSPGLLLDPIPALRQQMLEDQAHVDDWLRHLDLDQLPVEGER